MKKYYSLLLFWLFALPVAAQITNIQSTKNRFEFIGENIVYDSQTKAYEIFVRSNNQFEDKTAYINLGKTQTEILTNFKNLAKALQKPRTNFTIAGYTIYVLDDPGDAYIANIGKLANTAGIYHFTPILLGRALIELAQEKQWSIGSCEMDISIWGYTAAIDIILKDYDLMDYVSLSTTSYKDKFSQWFVAKEGDLLQPWQIAVVKNKIQEGIIENDADAKKFQFLTININVEEELKNAPHQPQINGTDKPAFTGNCKEDGVVFVVVEKMPEFPDGQAAMFQYLKDNLQYPQKAKDAGITGRAICQFVINTDGTICDVEIVRSAGNELLDAEAVRLVQSMPIWTPGMQRGENVRVKYTVPVNFR
jgi:protein TonB